LRSSLLILLLLAAGPAAAQSNSDSHLVADATLLAITARAPEMVSRIQVSVVRQPKADVLSAGQPLQVELPALPVIPRGRLQVKLSRNGESLGTAQVNVAHFDSVATATAAVASGADVITTDLRFVWMETTRFSGDPLTPAALSAFGNADVIARRSLRADRALRTSDVGPRPAADTGDSVRMLYRRGSFVMDLSCRARDRGQIGDIIRLYADDSDTTYRARLTAPGRAEWIETL
jgi:flagella basal body P-ring formation protein FlgA